MVSLAELYEFHASECVRAAERTDNPQLRERYLRLAREWRRDIANLPGSSRRPAKAVTIPVVAFPVFANRSERGNPNTTALSLALRRVKQQIAESLGGLRLCLKGAY
jgi:hypothetical protein